MSDAGGSADFQEIAALFARVEACFLNLAQAPGAVRALWDSDIANPVYLPEEHSKLITGWAEMDAYFAATGQALSPVLCRYELQTLVPLAQDLVTAYCRMEWQAAILPAVERLGGHVRVIAVLRRKPAGWRFVSYVEAPLAPMLYLQELYKTVARISDLRPQE